MSVPTNLIPTLITGLQEYTGSSTLGYMPYILDGRTYKVQFANIAAVGAVPSSRVIAAGTGLAGGGDLSANRVISIAAGGVGVNQLSLTGVTAGTYGSGSDVPVLTVDATGRVTSVTTAALSVTGFVPTSRTITAGNGLTGGGSLASDITLSANFSTTTPLALGSATAGVAITLSRGDHVHPALDLSDTNQTQGALPLGRGGTGDALSPVAGAVVYSTGTKFALSALGSAGQVLVSNGTSAPSWLTLTGTGTVTSVNLTAGTGISVSGGPITAAGSINVVNTAPDQVVSLTGAGTTVVTGTYPSFTITSTDSAAGTVTSVNASGGTTGLSFTGGPITTSGTLTLGGTLAIANGGTGAIDAPTALTNLGAYPASNPSGFTSNVGTVTSVSGTGTVSGLSLSGTVTSTGSLTLGGTLAVLPSNFASQTANTVLAAPNGSAGTPTFRAIVAADVPTLNQNTTGTASNVTGIVAVLNGGTGASVAGTARTNLLAAGSGANTDITSIALTTGTVSATPTSGTDIVNKLYADSIASGINFHQSVRLATAAALPANTYNNGASGVGATLTANANGALTVDGVAAVAGNRILVKNEVTQANNGVYTVTQVGDGSTPYILTRATDFDSAGSGVDQIDAGDFFLVTAGTTQSNTSWVQQTPLPITVGTTALVFTQFAAPVLYSAGTGLTLAGTVFSITNTGVAASTYGSASSVPVIAVNAQGQATSVTNTPIAIAATQITSGTFTVGQGGTGQSSYTDGQLLIGNSTGNTLTKATLTAGTNVSITNGSGAITINAADQYVGTVTSVSGTGTVSGLTLTGTVTTSGSLTLGGTLAVTASDFASQTAKYFLAAPNASSGVPSFRAIIPADVPTLNQNTTGTASNVTGTVAVANGGTGATTLTSGYLVKGNGTSAVSASVVYDTGTNVGIGTASPQALFTISSGSGTKAVWQTTRSFTVNRNFQLAVDEYVEGAFTITPSTAIGGSTYTTPAVVVTGAGDVGIGITTPIAYAGYGNLTINGTSGGTLTLRNSANTNSSEMAVTASEVYLKSVASTPLWFGTNNTERMRIDTSGNLMLGTTSSSSGFTVQRAGSDSAEIKLNQTGSGGRDYRIGSTGTGYGSAGNLIFYDATATAERMRIDSSGNVGIGTTAPATKLEVADSGTVRITALNTTNTVKTQLLSDTTSGYVGTDSNHPLSFFTNQVVRATITSAGSVGIGTSSPLATLHVVGAASSTSVSPPAGTQILSHAGGFDVGSYGASLNFVQQWWSGAPASLISVGQITGLKTAGNGNFGGGLAFFVGPSGAGSSTMIEAMRIDGNGQGNVGIGETSPGSRLQVNGNIRVSNGTGFTSANSLVRSIQTMSGSANQFVSSNIDFYTAAFTDNGQIAFSTGGAEAMRINGSSNVGIGTSSPSQRLDVKSQINVTSPSNISMNAVRASNFGYSTGYSALIIGSTSGNNTPCINVDPIANASGAFGGLGNEVMFRNGVSFITPNAANTAYEREVLTLVDGKVGVSTITPGAKLETFNSVGGTNAIRMNTNFASGNYVDLNPFISGVSNGGYSISLNGTIRQVISYTGDVGIGTTAPVQKLHVVGLINSSDGASSRSVIGWTSATTWGGAGLQLINVDNSNLILGTNNTGRLLIDTNGNVGIGTTTPASRLNVSGTTAFTWSGGSTSSGLVTIGTQGTGGSLFVNTASLNTSFASGLAVDGTYSHPSSVVNLKAVGVNSGGSYNASLAFHTSFETTLSEKMRIASGGNVGIGTTSPSTKLAVSNGGAAGLEFEPIGGINGGSYIQSYNRSTSAYTHNTNYALAQTWYVGNGSRAMDLTSTGTVGIGTSAPGTTLHVSGGLIAGSENRQTHPDASAAGGFKAQWNFSGGSAETDFYNLYNGAASSFRFYQSTGSGTAQLLYNMQSNSHEFYISGGEAMRLNSNGQLLIGTTTAVQTLTIGSGSASSSGINLRTTQTDFVIVPSNSAAGGVTIGTSWVAGGQGPLIFTNANGEIMRLSAARGLSVGTTTDAGSGNILASGNVTAYSDIRVKDNVEQIAGALDRVQRIRGVTYTRTDLEDTERRYAGVIAQEIEEVLPEAIFDTGELKAVDYNATIGLLIEAIKELTARVAQLEGK